MAVIVEKENKCTNRLSPGVSCPPGCWSHYIASYTACTVLKSGGDKTFMSKARKTQMLMILIKFPCNMEVIHAIVSSNTIA